MKNYLKGKTWIDWVKVLLAIDVALVGIGLVFQESLHLLAHILGPVSRIFFGVLYIILAAHLFKTVFPNLIEDLKRKEKKVEQETDEVVGEVTEEVEEEKKSIGEMVDQTAKKVDTFIQGRAQEAKEEVKKALDE